ncbi:MAG: hypothetical protein CML65_04700 [Rhodobacteraceae bacterium]|nr:hypothetical protein [Paracoccaceae bacterium]
MGNFWVPKGPKRHQTGQAGRAKCRDPPIRRDRYPLHRGSTCSLNAHLPDLSLTVISLPVTPTRLRGPEMFSACTENNTNIDLTSFVANVPGSDAMTKPSIEADLLARIAQLEAENATLRKAAETDPMTGLGNRAALARTLTAGAPVALALVDVDDLHGLNSRHGHPVADTCLVEMGRRIRAALLPGEVAIRLGGDEFAVLTTRDTSAAELAGLHLRLARACRLVTGQDWDGPAAGASIGTGLREPGETYDEMYRRVDATLYASKRASRSAA